MHQEQTSANARKNFYKILKRVGEGGDTCTIKVYKKSKVRIIREELAEILEEAVGKNVWYEIHKILENNPHLEENSKETIRKLVKKNN